MLSGTGRVSRVVGLIFVLIIALLLIRFVLTTIGINANAAAVSWYYYVTKAIASPFGNLFIWERNGHIGPVATEWTILIAAAAYFIVGAIIVGILRAFKL